MSGNLAIAKLGVQLATSLGVAKIVGDIIKNNVTVVTTVQKVTVTTASLVLGSMIVDQTSSHIETVATDVTDWLEKRKNDKETEK
jgi:hypothetical protein